MRSHKMPRPQLKLKKLFVNRACTCHYRHYWRRDESGFKQRKIELLGREGHNVTKVSRRDLLLLLPPEKMAQPPLLQR